MDSLAFIHLAEAYNHKLELPQMRVKAPKRGWRSLMALIPLGLTASFLGMSSPALALLRQGESGKEVNQIQYRLQELGYFQTDISGYYGDITKQAVKHFQKENGLTPDGIVGPQTLAALNQKYPQTPKPSTQPTVKLGNDGGTVVRVQRQLSSLGYLNYKKIDGTFDAQTKAALKQFQADYGLKADGVVGLKTHTALRNYTGL
ncbi:peptidoglycan-binding domain-containing protein [Phormidium sp. CCY1219]|uniref:peptidoglycan-binding domain-containing protein n=1 Tax=Phormidium sp. CCY1219 TaxID=2886104 RepID=UPI002D1E5BC6|nr:peptidoglycan-binding protein [Phormidium sp. CCY1219]MEB3826315.1 peptidoglycan-binding protein [Phormidium sp. CCY1219]